MREKADKIDGQVHLVYIGDVYIGDAQWMEFGPAVNHERPAEYDLDDDPCFARFCEILRVD